GPFLRRHRPRSTCRLSIPSCRSSRQSAVRTARRAIRRESKRDPQLLAHRPWLEQTPAAYERVALRPVSSRLRILAKLVDNSAHVIEIGTEMPDVAEPIEQLLEDRYAKRDEWFGGPQRVERRAACYVLIIEASIRKDRVADSGQSRPILTRREAFVCRGRNESPRLALFFQPPLQART